jgi:hypothetical protein
MRQTLVVALGLALLAVPAQAAQREDSATRTIRLISRTVNLRTTVDKPPKGVPNKGDAVREESVLHNAVAQFGRPKGAPVGSDVGIYRVTATNPVRMSVTVIARLPGGTLRGTAQVAGNTVPTIRVVGGTGAFANARGTGDVRPYSGRPRGVLNIYRLRLP